MKKVLIGLAILVAVIAAGALGFFLLDKSSEQTAKEQRLFLIEAKLNKSTEKYAKCYNSVNYGTSLIGDVRLKIIGENFYDDSITPQRLDVIQESFMDTVRSKCDATIAGYENDYDEYKRLSEQTGETASWLSLLIGGTQSPSIGNKLTEFDPSMVRVFSGSSFNNYIFTKEEVEIYFSEKLAA